MLNILLVLVTPAKTQHCPYLTGIPPLLWYCFRMALLPHQAEGEVPSLEVLDQLPTITPLLPLALICNKGDTSKCYFAVCY